MSVSIREVAKNAGVSPTTVSQVLRGTNYFPLATQEKVMTAARHLKYRSRSKESSPVNFRPLRIALLHFINQAKGFTDFSLNVLNHLQEVLQPRGHSLMLESGNNPNLLKALEAAKIDGILVLGGLHGERCATLEKVKPLPIVLLGNRGPDPYEAVVSDNQDGIGQVVRHLRDLGHSRMGFIMPEENHWSCRQRFLGFLDAMAQARLETEKPYEYLEDLGEVHEKIRKTLDTGVTAVVCCRDCDAAATYSEAERRGLRVGKDLAVTGYDDTEIARHLTPRLTSVVIPYETLCQNAVRAMETLVQDTHQRPTTTLVPVTLAIRGSTDPSKD